MIKLIATDIDGTLVTDGGNELNPEYYPVILKLRSQGVQFVAASGRQWVSIERLFEPIKEKIFYVSDNGAYIGCHGRSLYSYEMEPQLVEAIVKDVREIPGLEIMTEGLNSAFLETKDEKFLSWLIDCYKFQVEQVDDVLKTGEPVIKVSIYAEKNVEEAARSIYEKYKDKLKIAIAGDMWMDCMSKGVSKGAAIRILQESLDIKPEETMCFGDQLNDIEMLNQAYYSFAIGNARKEVKEAARFQADTNKRDGVLKILKLLAEECG